MKRERPSNDDAPELAERVLLLDAELAAPAPALHVDGAVARGIERRVAAKAASRARPTSARGQRAPADAPPRGKRPEPVDGVEFGNVATEILEPFVRAIEVLLRGLADSLGEEASGPATVAFGSTVIEYSSPGGGDDVVRVYRSGPSPLVPPGAGRSADAGRRPRDPWEMGALAAREGDHAGALKLFEAEARQAEENGQSQRAAIAFRSASREAGLSGRRDYANMLLRLAGKHYLEVAEDPDTSARGKVQSLVTAAKCFLQAGNLPLAATCIDRARSAGEALGEGAGGEPGDVA